MVLVNFTANTIIKSSDVDANFSGLADGSLDTTSNSLATFRQETLPGFVMSGMLIPTSANLSATTSAGQAYVNGKRVITSTAAHTYNASKDTYVDLKDDGTFAYVEVANGATTGMTLTANAIRIAKVISSGSAITSVQQIPVLQNAGAVGNWWGGFDPIGNRIYPQQGDITVGRTARNFAATTGAPGGTSVSYNGTAAIPCILKTGNNYIFDFFEPVINGYSGTGDFIIELYLGTSSGAFTTMCNECTVPLTGGNRGIHFQIPFNSGSYSGLTWIGIKLRSGGWSGTINLNSDATRTGIFSIYKA